MQGSMPIGDILPELILLGGAVVALVYSLFTPRRLQAVASAIALAAVAGAALASAMLLREPQSLTFFGTYAKDGAAIWGKLIVLLTAAVILVFSLEWFRLDPRRGELNTLILFSALGAIVLAGATDLMEIALGVLLSSATAYVLAAYHRRSKVSAEAAIKFYLLSAFTNGAMVFGIVLLFGLGATTILSELQVTLPDAGGPALAVATGLVVLGLAFKMGAVPAHAWMPDVADGAPAPMAALLLSAPKVGALIALGRLALTLPEDGVGWRPLIALLAAATMTLGNLAALWQDDLRRLLGWSAVSQTGYGLMALVSLGRSELAIPALLYFLAAYVLANLAAFGVVIELRGRRAVTDYAGLAGARPALALALVVSFTSFIGIPPLAGFTAKLALFGAAIEAGYGWLAVLASANTVVSLAYYALVLGPAYFGRPVEAFATGGRAVALVTGACALAIVALGIGAELMLEAFGLVVLLPQ